MFETLIDRIEKVKRKIFGVGRITQKELTDFLQDLRLTLLEADVNYRVVKDFANRLEARCRDLKLAQAINPADLLLKVVYDEIVKLLGEENKTLVFGAKGPYILSLVGLQGTGKTTTAVKLAVRFKSRKPLLVAADTKRPAAREQLKSLATKASIDFFESVSNDPVEICKTARAAASGLAADLVILDTAGRLHIDQALIQELIAIKETVKPDWTVIVVDGMTGQDAVNQVRDFHRQLGLSGAILTKLDGDARGGACLSIVAATQVPVLFIGTGERTDCLEEFHPDRIAARVLGMGDVRTLIEKFTALQVKPEEERIDKIKKGIFNLEDFRQQFQQIKKLGPLAGLASMIPGVKSDDIDEGEMVKAGAILDSMTKLERSHPEIIDGSRKRRIASGSGTTVQDVNQLLKQFFMAKQMLQQMSKGKTPSITGLDKKIRKVIKK